MAAALNTIQSSNQASNTTTHTVSIPSGYATNNVGLIAIIFLSSSGGIHPGTITAPGDWPLYKSVAMSGSGSNNYLVNYYLKPALGASESSAVFTSQNAVPSTSVCMDIAAVKPQTANMPNISTSTTSTTTTDATFSSTTITTSASESLLIDLVVAAASTSGLSQSTSGWTTAASSSLMWGVASQLSSPAGSFSGPTWSWTDTGHRYAGLRIAMPSLTSNLQPIATIGSGYSVYALPGQTINLSSTSTDPDGSIASYQWQNLSSYDVGVPTITNATSQTCSLTLPDQPNKAYTIGLTVTDNQGAQSPQAKIAVVVQDGTQAVQGHSGSAWTAKPRLIRQNGVWH